MKIKNLAPRNKPRVITFCVLSFGLLFCKSRFKYESASSSNITTNRLHCPYVDENFERSFNHFLKSFKIYVYEIQVDLEKIYEKVAKIETAQQDIRPEWIVKRMKKMPHIKADGQYALEFWMRNWIVKSIFHTRKVEEANAYFVDFQCTSRKTQGNA